ncbi:MAG TPA: hypothetical protein VGP81_12205 [Pyrinomonadaceae bacterium]|nr:hypothetical protein [Pyrinomonadaceae bacterium]
MKAFRAVAYLGVVFSLAAFVSGANKPVQEKPQSVVGVVVQTDGSRKALTIRSDAGETISVQTDDSTALVRIPAGERTLANAATIQFSDIMAGDRVLSSGTRAGRNFIAQRVVVMPAAEVEKKRQHDLDEWKQRGIGGIVRETNAQAGTIAVELRGSDAGTRLMIETTKAHFRRYVPGSLRFEDARASNFDEVRAGDQLRALGDKTGDGKFTAEQIVSGAFKTIGVTVTAVDQSTSKITAATLDQKKPVTISVNKDSVLHRIPPPVAVAIAQKAKGEANKSPTQTAAAKSDAPAKSAGPAQPGPKAGQPVIDVQQMIDSLPTVLLADIKPGDVLAVTGAIENDDAHLVAIKVAAGVDLVLKALAPAAGRPQAVRLSAGLPAVFDFSVIPVN